MKKLALAVAIVSLGAAALIATAIAKNGSGGGSRSFSAKLSGYEEIIPASLTNGTFTGEAGAVSTTGRGRFSARVRDDRIEYELRYEALEGDTTTQAHIHFGQKHTVGGVSAFLCGDAGVPDPPPANDIPDSCPAGSGTVDGTITSSEVVGPAGQGIAAGELAELIRAIRNGAAYVNVHTSGGTPAYPTGEIRGQIQNGRHHGRGKGRDD
jgi:hypothetical protein